MPFGLFNGLPQHTRFSLSVLFTAPDPSPATVHTALLLHPLDWAEWRAEIGFCVVVIVAPGNG